MTQKADRLRTLRAQTLREEFCNEHTLFLYLVTVKISGGIDYVPGTSGNTGMNQRPLPSPTEMDNYAVTLCIVSCKPHHQSLREMLAEALKL